MRVVKNLSYSLALVLSFSNGSITFHQKYSYIIETWTVG